MFSDNVQYQVKKPLKLRLSNGEKMLPEGRFTAGELSAFIGRNLLIAPIYGSENIFKTSKLAGITEIVISLNKLNNSDNLEDGKPTNILLKHHMTSSKEFTNYEPVIPQYKKLKNGEFTSITLRIMDQKKNIMSDGPTTTAVLNI